MEPVFEYCQNLINPSPYPCNFSFSSQLLVFQQDIYNILSLNLHIGLVVFKESFYCFLNHPTTLKYKVP